jgi:hypothetical protein
LTIVSCHVCGQKLRVPDGKRGTVNCKCGAQWFHPETIELSDVEFRCSMSGARFNVISLRRSPLHKFVVQEINKAAPGTGRPSSLEPGPSSEQPALQAVAPSFRIAPPRVGGWFARIAVRNADVIPSKPPIPEPLPTDEPLSPTTRTAPHDPDEYNWSGFSCPYCSATSFVACTSGHLACDGTAELRNGRRFHQCFCGQAGFIGGTMKAIESKRLSVGADSYSRKPSAVESQGLSRKHADAALPPPTKAIFPRSDND